IDQQAAARHVAGQGGNVLPRARIIDFARPLERLATMLASVPVNSEHGTNLNVAIGEIKPVLCSVRESARGGFAEGAERRPIPQRCLCEVQILRYPDSMRRSLNSLAPAKLNLALSVGPPGGSTGEVGSKHGAAGLHPICSWMVTVDLFDELLLT